MVIEIVAGIIAILYVLFSHPENLKWLFYIGIAVFAIFAFGGSMVDAGKLITSPIGLIFIGFFVLLFLTKRRR